MAETQSPYDAGNGKSDDLAARIMELSEVRLRVGADLSLEAVEVHVAGVGDRERCVLMSTTAALDLALRLIGTVARLTRRAGAGAMFAPPLAFILLLAGLPAAHGAERGSPRDIVERSAEATAALAELQAERPELSRDGIERAIVGCWMENAEGVEEQWEILVGRGSWTPYARECAGREIDARAAFRRHGRSKAKLP